MGRLVIGKPFSPSVEAIPTNESEEPIALRGLHYPTRMFFIGSLIIGTRSHLLTEFCRRVLRRVLRRGACYGFCSKRGF